MEIRVKIEKWQAFSILFAIVLLTGVIIGVNAYNSSPANPVTMGHSVDEIDWTGFDANSMINWSKTISQLLINPSTNANLRIGKNILFNGAVSISATNDANNLNTPLEIRASKTLFTYGDVCVDTASGEKCLGSGGGGVLTPSTNVGGSCNDRCSAIGRTCGFGMYEAYWGGADATCDANNPGVRMRCWCN